MLATKLRRPALPGKRVSRPHLIRRLTEGLELGRQLTLISAPAGYGKSICAAEWVSTLDLPVAWVSLDPSDDNPARFFTYVVAGLQQVDEAMGLEISGVLNAGQLPPADVVAASLIQDIEESGVRFLLVLDDLQAVQDQAIRETLVSLIGNQPRNLHLVLLTREEPSLPLARLRANNRITEIRAADLRFNHDEAGSFLNGVMGLSLSPADIARLEAKTEGWIAGLQLAGLSMRDQPDPSGFVARLTGSHRYILSYLTEEVLGRQPPDIQQFLLQTSVLTRLTGDLCDAVTERTDSGALLERLFQENLFLIPLDDEQRWYRYHHLFADLLHNVQQARQKEETAELHRRASRWYARAGLAGEAIRHALDGADYGLAVHLLEAHATALIMQGYAQTVEGWLQALPAEMLLHSPRSNLAFAWMHLMRGTPARAHPYLERLEAFFAHPGRGDADPALAAEWLSLKAHMCVGKGDAPGGLDLASRALELAPEADARVHGLACNGLATAHLLSGRYADAVAVFQKAIRHSRELADFHAELQGVSILAQVALQHGQYHLAWATAAPVMARLERLAALPPTSSVVVGALGQIHYQWRQFDQARRCLSRSVHLCTLGGYAEGEIYHRALLARLLHTEGDRKAAAAEMQKAQELMQAGAPVWVRAEVIAEQVRQDLAQNRLAAAQALLAGQGFAFGGTLALPEFSSDRSLTYEHGLICSSALRVLLHRLQSGEPPAGWQLGLQWSERLVSSSLADHYLPIAVKTLLLRAQLLATLGDRQAGVAECGRALALAAPEGLIGLFAEEGPDLTEALRAWVGENPMGSVPREYVHRILASLQPTAAAPAPRTMLEPLSGRELEVLACIAAGYSNQEISERLVLSLHTVKKHTSNIFAKLAVNSRTQAVARARHLGLLTASNTFE